MGNFLTNIFSPKFYIPHGHCYLWQTSLVLLHLISDLLIAIAYFSIPIMLLYFLYKRSNVPFQSFFVMFGAFIVFCGTGHLLEIWTLWHPAYWLSGVEQALTAVISCYTAIKMANLLPRFLSLKTPEQLEALNRELQKEIAERQKAETQLRRINEELETRVKERTAQLQRSAEEKQTITRIIRQMRQTLDLKQILAHTTKELRTAIKSERVLVYQFNADWSGRIVAESVADGWTKLISQTVNSTFTQIAIDRDNCVFKSVKDTYLQEFQGAIFNRENSYSAVDDVDRANFDPCYLELLKQLEAKAYLVVPIFYSNCECTDETICAVLKQNKNRLWGLLFAYELSSPRQWDSRTIEIMLQIGSQLGVAVQQGELLAQTQKQAKELSVAKNEAEKANRAKSEFLANMSHELENLFKLKAQDKKLQLSFERERNVPRYLKSDRQKLRQVLINLIGNAIKFTPKGRVQLNVSVEGEMLYFAIEDTGLGIAPEEIEQIFMPFKQAKAGQQSSEGTGLGLSISKVFVELMGGAITVNSTVGRTIFTFTIPLIVATSILPDKALTSFVPVAIAQERTFRILVAEDRLTNRQLMVKILTSVGFQVREAVNGSEAIALWQEWQPHLIWMDMQMPIMTGFEASQQIKASPRGQETIIIAITASAFEEDRQKILAYGCDDMVSKPFRPEELFNKMAQYLGVKYLYRDRKTEQKRSLSTNYTLTSASFKVMSSEWLEQLKQLTSEGNYAKLQNLVTEIPLEHQNLKIALTELVENFQFEVILNLISQ